MLSGPTFSTDILTNRIMGVEPPNKKSKWENVENYLDNEANIGFSGNTMGRFLENAQLKSASPGFMNELIDSQPFLYTSQSSNSMLSSSYTCGLSINNSINCGLPDTDKFPIGNREELTTPIGLTSYDSSGLLENTYLYNDATHDAVEQQMLLHSRDPYPFGFANTQSTAVNQMTTTNRAELDVETLMLTEQGFLPGTSSTTRQNNLSSSTATATPTTPTFEFAPSSSYTNDTVVGEQQSYMMSSQPNGPQLDDTGRQLLQEHDTAGTLNSPMHSQTLLSFDGTEMQPKTEREYLGETNVESEDSTFLFRYGGANDTRKGGGSSLSASEQELRDTPLEELYGGCMDFIRQDGHVFEDRQSTPHPFGSTLESVDTRRDNVSGKYKHASTHTITDHASANSEKRCKVCGDRAVNHNFGQLTCESCKAFFRRNAHKELSCTSKTGEHEITPSTRRECPACRLKKCFLVGMRPDLIQVRKKDGSKPRWLDKVPSAAIVHEKHLQSNELQGKSVWSTASKGKSQHTIAGRVQKQTSGKESREDVCSSDSGSCLSMEVNSTVPIDASNPCCHGLQKTENPNLFEQGVAGLVPAPVYEAVQAAGLDTSNNTQQQQLCDQFVHLNYDIGSVNRSVLDFQSGMHTCNNEGQQQSQELPNRPACSFNLPDCPSGSVYVTSNSGSSISVVQLSPKVTKVLPAAAAAASVTQYSSVDTFTPGLQPISVHPVGSKCPVTPTEAPSINQKVFNTLEDFLLVSNTPRLVVPTNLVTIGMVTTANTQAVLTTRPIASIPKPVDLGVNIGHLSQESLSAPFHYTQCPQNISEKQSVQPILSTDAVLKESTNQTIMTPLWSPPPIQTTNIIHVANHATNSSVPTLVPSFPTCVLTTPIQSLSPQNTLINSTPMLNNSFTLAGNASIRLPIDTVSSSSVGAVTLTAILPKTSPQVIRSENLIPNQSALLLSNTMDSSIIVAQAPQPINCSTSYIGVLSQSTDWSTTSARVKSEVVPTSSMFQFTGFPDDTRQHTAGTEGYWRVSPMEQSDSSIPDSSTLLKTEDPLNHLLSSSISNGQIRPEEEWINECSVQMITRAWKAMWNAGLWPNPHSVKFNFGTASVNPTSWRSSIASLWIDIFLRRISTFAVHLYCSLCHTKPSDALQTLISEAQSDTSSTSNSDLGKPKQDEQAEAPWLMWSDVMWMAEHRFMDCIPILLISCLQCAKSTQALSASGTSTVESKFPDFGLNGLCVSMGSDAFFNSQVGTVQTKSNCDSSRLISYRNSHIVWSSTERDSASLDFLDSTDTHDIVYCKTDVDGTTALSLGDTYETENEPTVHFQCESGGHVYLSLTNLSSALAKIQTDITKHSQRGHPSYPILQYLDSYVIRFGSFLAYHPILLGAFMALKLTDPGDSRSIVESQESINPTVRAAREERDRRLRRLHEQFITVFSDAADLVALEASQKRHPRYQEDLLEQVGLTYIKPEERDAANSRRAMLNDFLTWSRTFDSAWREFQKNTWVQLVQSDTGRLDDAAQRLTAFYAPDGSISQSATLELVVESLNELISHTS